VCKFADIKKTNHKDKNYYYYIHLNREGLALAIEYHENFILGVNRDYNTYYNVKNDDNGLFKTYKRGVFKKIDGIESKINYDELCKINYN